MRGRIKKRNQPVSVAIPVPLPESISQKSAHAVDVPKERNPIAIESSEPHTYTLEELEAGITPSNRHKEIIFGHVRGRELI